jgi:hypothetical protein
MYNKVSGIVMNISFGIYPFNLIATVVAFLALVAGAAAGRARSGRGRALMVVLGMVFLLPAAGMCLAFHPEFSDGRFWTYKAFYRDIQTGMTRDEVFAALDRRYPKLGARQPPMVMGDQPMSLSFFMNPETSSEPNCEGIFLTLDKGRVTRKVYSPD